MPKIEGYSTRLQVQGPIEQRRASLDEPSLGQVLSNFGRAQNNLLDRATKRAEQQEISDLNAKYATAQSEFTVHLQETLRNTDPAQHAEVTEKFMTEFDEYTGKLSENLNTTAARMYSQKTSAQMRGHFYERATEGQAALAGVKAKQDHQTVLNSYSSALVTDPTAFEFTLGKHAEAVANLKGTLDPATIAKLDSEGKGLLAESAVKGLIEADPVYAKKQLMNGAWDQYLQGDKKAVLLGAANTAIRADEVESKRLKADADEKLKQEQRATENKFIALRHEGKLSAKDIISSNLEPDDKRLYLNWLEADIEKKPKTNHAVYRSAVERIHLPDEDPRKITDERVITQMFVDGHVSFEDMKDLREELAGRRTEAGRVVSDMKKSVEDQAEAALVKKNTLGQVDPDGVERMGMWKEYFRQEYKRRREAGESDAEILNPGTPQNPNPKYIGHDLQRFTKTPNQVMKDRLQRMRSRTPTVPIDPAKARKPGETPEEYAKRMGL